MFSISLLFSKLITRLSFPAANTHEDIINSTSKGKGGLFLPGKVMYNTTKAVPMLLKEYGRRLGIHHQDIEQLNPNPQSGYPGLPKRNPTRKDLIESLQKLKHPPGDVPYIIAAFAKFTASIRAHYFMQCTGGRARPWSTTLCIILLMGVRSSTTIA
jgi:hypothetical protein